ncbi:hypothetical protein AWZ03_000585 [Drosophila navojoa]|uniref:Uncharacterized protein n=2 Tax=Drosophila navojoa TaxID=7232 RepID=A0A484BZ32_DRONA|nr:hypothetical protein AWZ03_000585 [Drosophila navojoa]
MPRRRRPRCKVKPLIALHEDPAGDSEASQEEQVESKSDDADVPAETHDVPMSVSPSEWEYRLFPELHNQLPALPTFTDIFGQHSDVMYQENAPAPLPDAEQRQAIGQQQQQQEQQQQQQEAASAPAPASQLNGTTRPLLPDIFGLDGLVANLRASRSSTANAIQLVTGEDLTTYGLDLASQGDIYVHFNGPFTQQPAGRSSANCALELGMRGMRDAMDKYPSRPPIWDPFVPETRNLGLIMPLSSQAPRLSVTKLSQPSSHEKSA